MLEFTAAIDGMAINGVDIIWNADGRIVNFKMRPLEAIDILHRKMAEVSPARAPESKSALTAFLWRFSQ